MSASLKPRRVAQIQEAQECWRVKLLENMSSGGPHPYLRGEEIVLYRPLAEVEYLASQGLLLIVDPAWQRAVVVDNTDTTEN